MDEQEKKQTREFEQAEAAAEHIALLLIAFRSKLVEAELPDYFIERMCEEYLTHVMTGR